MKTKLKPFALVGPFVFFAVFAFGETQPAREPAVPSTLTRFVDALPIPPRLKVSPNNHDITIRLNQFKYSFHRDLPSTYTWGYNGTTPGPTVEVKKGSLLRIHWRNNLPKKHILPMTSGMDAMGPNLPESRAVTHLHGAFVTESDPMNRFSNNDGWPDAWTTRGQTQQAEYPNEQEASTLWYHDHAIGITGRNVYAGLEGFYLIHDDFEQSLHLPSGKYDIPLMIQGRSFASDGSMIYPRGIPLEVYGNAITVNGKVWPYLEVEPRRYRFRVLNAANARPFSLNLVTRKSGAQGPRFYQIGSDGGFLESPILLNDPKNEDGTRLQLAPGERADIIIDFSKFAGEELRLDNNAVPEEPTLGPPLADVMLFRVGKKTIFPDTSEIPPKLRPIEKMKLSNSTTSRQIELSETDMADGTQMMLLNGKAWKDPVTEKAVLGTTEIWEVINTTDDNHPFHIHSIQFQVLDRRPFDVDRYRKEKTVDWTGTAISPNPNEMGWKDTVVATPGEVTRIIMKFSHYAGHYVYHCHILEHEDMDMMRPFDVVAP